MVTPTASAATAARRNPLASSALVDSGIGRIPRSLQGLEFSTYADTGRIAYPEDFRTGNHSVMSHRSRPGGILRGPARMSCRVRAAAYPRNRTYVQRGSEEPSGRGRPGRGLSASLLLRPSRYVLGGVAVLNGLLAAVPPIAGGGWGPGPHPGFWWIWPLAWLLFLAALATVLALVAWRRPARRSWS